MIKKKFLFLGYTQHNILTALAVSLTNKSDSECYFSIPEEAPDKTKESARRLGLLDRWFFLSRYPNTEKEFKDLFETYDQIFVFHPYHKNILRIASYAQSKHLILLDEGVASYQLKEFSDSFAIRHQIQESINWELFPEIWLYAPELFKSNYRPRIIKKIPLKEVLEKEDTAFFECLDTVWPRKESDKIICKNIFFDQYLSKDFLCSEETELFLLNSVMKVFENEIIFKPHPTFINDSYRYPESISLWQTSTPFEVIYFRSIYKTNKIFNLISFGSTSIFSPIMMMGETDNIRIISLTSYLEKFVHHFSAHNFFEVFKKFKNVYFPNSLSEMTRFAGVGQNNEAKELYLYADFLLEKEKKNKEEMFELRKKINLLEKRVAEDSWIQKILKKITLNKI